MTAARIEKRGAARSSSPFGVCSGRAGQGCARLRWPGPEASASFPNEHSAPEQQQNTAAWQCAASGHGCSPRRGSTRPPWPAPCRPRQPAAAAVHRAAAGTFPLSGPLFARRGACRGPAGPSAAQRPEPRPVCCTPRPARGPRAREARARPGPRGRSIRLS